MAETVHCDEINNTNGVQKESCGIFIVKAETLSYTNIEVERDSMGKMDVRDIPLMTLPNEKQIPIIGYGTGTSLWKRDASTGYDSTIVSRIKTAIDTGYHLLDSAEIYNSELELGHAVKSSSIPRSNLFIISKVSTNIHSISSGLETTLRNLGVDYIDLHLIHSPFSFQSDKEIQDIWREMEKVQKAGKTRMIGVSNFLQSHLETLLKAAEIRPVVNQIEFHPYLQHGSLLDYHKSQGIATMAYSPLTPILRARGGPLDGSLQRLSEKYRVSEGVVLLRWCIQKGVIPVSTSGNGERLREYLEVLGMRLEDGEMEEIGKVGEGFHFRTFWRDYFEESDRS